MALKSFTKYSNFDNEYNSDDPIDNEEKEEQEYDRKHNTFMKSKQSKKQEQFTCKHKYKHEQILYYRSSRCKIRTLTEYNNMPMYRIYPFFNNKNIHFYQIYKLISGKNISDYNKRIYKKYSLEKLPKINNIVYIGKLDNPLSFTLTVENHYEWKICKINNDNTFDLERTDDNIECMNFVMENELSENPI